MSVAVWTSFQQLADANGSPYSGALVNVYAAGTTTPLSLYTDSSLSTGADNPIVCLSDGTHPMRYMATASYKTAVTTSAGAPLTSWSKDNIDPGVAVGSGALPVLNGGTGSTTAGGARTNLGAAAESTVTAIASDVTTLQGYHAGTSATPIATGTTAQRPGSPSNYNLRGNSSLTSPEMYLEGTWHKISLAPAIAGGFKNLRVINNSGTPNSQIDVDADAVTVETTDGVAFRLNSVNLTINCATTGANGLDAGALANSTWYSVWVIFNPSTGTTAGLASVSASAPTMPSGYTAKARFGWLPTNSSANFLRVSQKGNRAQYVVGSGTTTTSLPAIASGTLGTYSASSPTWAAQSISTTIPSTASRCILVVSTNRLGGTPSITYVAPNGSYAGVQGANPPPIATAGSIATIAEFQLESTNIYVASGATDALIQAFGWEDVI